MNQDEQKRTEDRDKRLATLPPHIVEARDNAIMISDVKLSIQKSARVAPKGPSLPEVLAGPTHEVPSPKLDNLIAHEARVQRDNVVGEFCNIPIITLDKIGMDVDAAVDQSFRLKNSSGVSISIDLLPGEKVCKDNIARRADMDASTTTVLCDANLVDKKVHLLGKGSIFAVSTVHLQKDETVWTEGVDHLEYKEFTSKEEAEQFFQAEARGTRISIAEARQASEGTTILWRPNNNEYALILNVEGV